METPPSSSYQFAADHVLDGPVLELFQKRMGDAAGLEFHLIWQEQRRLEHLAEELGTLLRLPANTRQIVTEEIGGFYLLVCHSWWRELIIGVCALAERQSKTRDKSFSIANWCKRHWMRERHPIRLRMGREFRMLKREMPRLREFRNKKIAHLDVDRLASLDGSCLHLDQLGSMLDVTGLLVELIQEHYAIEPYARLSLFGGAGAFVDFVNRHSNAQSQPGKEA